MRIVLTIFLTGWLALLVFIAPAIADESAARSALAFAEQRDWANAREVARKENDEALMALIEWQYLLDADSGAGFDEIRQFMEEHADWPEQKRLRLRAEAALKDGALPASEIISYFASSPPLTGAGKMALAAAYQQTGSAGKEKIAQLVREAWKDGDFDEAQEKAILVQFGSLLRHEDDVARIDRLLWEEKTTSAKRSLDRVSRDYQKLFKARMALIEDKKTAMLPVGLVPANLKNDPGLIYERLRQRARKGDDKGVRELLLKAPAQPPYPAKWWKFREYQVREAIDERRYELAGKLMLNHGQAEGQEMADASWLLGWLQLRFLNQPKDALASFERMYQEVRYPVSKSRAAYWAGRAAEMSGDSATAARWYHFAASNPTAFYGQLALLKQKPHAELVFPSSPAGGGSEFESSLLGRAIVLAAQAGSDGLAGRMIGWVIESSDDVHRVFQAAQLGKRIGHDFLSVRGAKKALQKNIILIEAGYPTPATPAGIDVERALVLAIARQESEFDPLARSPSGALGMMQLLPKTAKENARKMDIDFVASRLYEPDYNMRLGSHYLSRLLGSYSGSYVMAIAAYNAGPGNVRKWIAQFATPGSSAESAVDWIEKIPFAETRNYVQRVLENVQVYRHIESSGERRLMMADDLVR